MPATLSASQERDDAIELLAAAGADDIDSLADGEAGGDSDDEKRNPLKGATTTDPEPFGRGLGAGRMNGGELLDMEFKDAFGCKRRC